MLQLAQIVCYLLVEVLIVIADKLEIVMEAKDNIQLEKETLFLKEFMENYSLNNSEIYRIRSGIPMTIPLKR